MKRLIAGFGFLLFFGIVGMLGTWEARYTKLATCIDYKNNIYTFTDNDGHTWEWDSETKSFQIGNFYKLVMDDNHTPNNIYDDKIITPKNY